MDSFLGRTNLSRKSKASSRLFVQWKSEIPAIKNTETFYYQTPIEDIPLGNYLILDGYAFDVEELEAYASVSSNKLYIN